MEKEEFLLGYMIPITFPKKAIDIDPYLLGYWLGDGDSNGTKFSTQESNVLVHINKECLKSHPELYISYTDINTIILLYL